MDHGNPGEIAAAAAVAVPPSALSWRPLWVRIRYKYNNSWAVKMGAREP
jgi:hypothetical protein